jgi:hypothetical protein
MDRKRIEIEKAWEQAFGNIFQPYTGPGRSPVPQDVSFQASSYDIKKHMAKTAARHGSTSLERYLQDDYWGKRPR